MKNPLSIQIQYSAEDFSRALRFIQSQFFLVKYGIYASPIIVFLSINLLFYFLLNDYDEPNYLAIMIFSIIPTIILTLIIAILDKFSPWLQKRRINKLIKSSPLLQDNLTIIFSDYGLESSCKLSSTKVSWFAFTKAMESEKDIFLYTSTKIAQFIPKSAFLSKEDEDYVRCLIRAKS